MVHHIDHGLNTICGVWKMFLNFTDKADVSRSLQVPNECNTPLSTDVIVIFVYKNAVPLSLDTKSFITRGVSPILVWPLKRTQNF